MNLQESIRNDLNKITEAEDGKWVLYQEATREGHWEKVGEYATEAEAKAERDEIIAHERAEGIDDNVDYYMIDYGKNLPDEILP
jgi:hypothetical protein